MKLITTSLALCLITLSLNAQHLLKDIGEGNGNTLLKPSSEYSTAVYNDTLPVITEITSTSVNLGYLVGDQENIHNFHTGFYLQGFVIKGFFYASGNFLLHLENYSEQKLILFYPNGTNQTLWNFNSDQRRIYSSYQVNSRVVLSEYFSQTGKVNLKVWNGGTTLSDLTNYQNNSIVQETAKIDNVLYFMGGTSANGGELWRTDGTNTGTYLVKDILPGPLGTNPTSIFKGTDGFIYFAGNVDLGGFSNGQRIYRTDGSEGSANLVFNSVFDHQGLYPRNLSQLSNLLIFDSNSRFLSYNLLTNSLQELVNFDSNGYFNFSLNGFVYSLRSVPQPPEQNRLELWKTDGTAAGTNMIKMLEEDIWGIYLRTWTGTESVFLELEVVKNYPHERTIQYWVSDGTQEGTKRLSDLSANLKSGVRKGGLGILGNSFLLNDYFEGSGYEVVKFTDDVIGLLADATTSPFSSNPENFFISGNKVYFMASNNKDGRELWETDGSASGTSLKFDLTGYNTQYTNGNSPQTETKDFATVTDGFFYFDVSRSLLKKHVPTTGTDITLLTNFSTYPQGFFVTQNSYQWHELTPFKNGIIFSNSYYTVGFEPWFSNGTPEGTYVLKDINPGGFSSYPSSFVSVNENLAYFRTDTPNAIWKTDGTESGTVLLDYLPQNVLVHSSSKPFVRGNNIYYHAFDYTNSQNFLFKVTPNSVTSIPFPGADFQSPPITKGNSIFFKGVNDHQRTIYELTTNDEIISYFTSEYYFSQLIPLNEDIFFTAFEADESSLYKLNGNVAAKVKTLVSNHSNAIPRSIDASHALITFKTYNTEGNYFQTHFLVTNGTTEGTRELFIYPGNGPIGASIFHENKFFFNFYTETTGSELWMIDFSCPDNQVISSPAAESGRFDVADGISVNTTLSPKTDLNAGIKIELNPGTFIPGEKPFKAEIRNCEF